MTAKDVREELNSAMQARRLMRFHRRFENGWVNGYVVGIGPEFLMLCEISDHIRFNGFGCYRLSDVKNLQPAPYPEFIEAALEKRGETQPETPAVVLNSLGDILVTAARLFPVVTVHAETAKSGVCYIGAIISVEGGVVWMQDIDPGAVWEREPIPRQLDTMTRVDFGGGYETALTLVGGSPPAPVEAKRAPLRLVADNG
ncbi:hypothetical protein [Caulobacter endophyticus]|uniref:hypothetical protein n=1 Tax=Caulobacter endophyticus TaxID=2172652 RepID=UPI00240EA866|nr:hypothetical protein [Caulobacter endophyticus]MDG2529817.1 hypothetical protein [Caulobacter endophyticus]